MRPYRAFVLGATGAVGSALVRELLAAPRCIGVTVAVRRPVSDLAANARPSDATKLAVLVIAMDRLESEVANAAHGSSVAFCTLGTGQPRKVSKEEFWKVDVEYAAAFARGCKIAGVAHASLLTATEADAQARSYYLKVKGSAEAAFRAVGFARTSFFRPSLLMTEEVRYGLQDRLTQVLFPMISWALPPRFHEVRVEDLARAMRLNAEAPAPAGAVEILHYPDYQRLLREV
jgi:uncharacterized protein YbjT (DUF2867 family)